MAGNSYLAISQWFIASTRPPGLKAIGPWEDDFTVFVILRKKDKDGKDMMHWNFPVHATPVGGINEIPERQQQSVNLHLGQMGILRASQRHIGPSKSIRPNFPFHKNDRQEPVPRGTVVKLEIGIWALGVDFDAGESISLRVGGHSTTVLPSMRTGLDPDPSMS
ncbi:hypothetical protein diail_8621 [Diaporthe ilicicola]|nr:hypothetical protein diail_8621 [Diaporthe ilicicola]